MRHMRRFHVPDLLDDLLDRLAEAAAMSHWSAGEPPALGPIKVVITHLFVGVSSDLDTLAKPVLDALQGLVYEDDGQVTDITLRRRDLARNLRVETPMPVRLNALNRGGGVPARGG